MDVGHLSAFKTQSTKRFSFYIPLKSIALVQKEWEKWNILYFSLFQVRERKGSNEMKCVYRGIQCLNKHQRELSFRMGLHVWSHHVGCSGWPLHNPSLPCKHVPKGCAVYNLSNYTSGSSMDGTQLGQLDPLPEIQILSGMLRCLWNYNWVFPM